MKKKPIKIKRNSLAGTLVNVLFDSDWHSMKDVRKIVGRKETVIKLGPGKYCVDGYVAGDDSKKGVSIVSFDTGKQLYCLIPEMPKYNIRRRWILKKIQKGIISFKECDEHERKLEILHLVSDNIAQCPYK